jgi:predicted DNA-binding transcriptional regulator YafY
MQEKYLNRVVDIVYQDKKGQFSKRRICVQSISDGKVRAFDVSKRAPRVFEVDRVLAVLPVGRAV